MSGGMPAGENREGNGKYRKPAGTARQFQPRGSGPVWLFILIPMQPCFTAQMYFPSVPEDSLCGFVQDLHIFLRTGVK